MAIDFTVKSTLGAPFALWDLDIDLISALSVNPLLTSHIQKDKPLIRPNSLVFTQKYWYHS